MAAELERCSCLIYPGRLRYLYARIIPFPASVKCGNLSGRPHAMRSTRMRAMNSLFAGSEVQDRLGICLLRNSVVRGVGIGLVILSQSIRQPAGRLGNFGLRTTSHGTGETLSEIRELQPDNGSSLCAFTLFQLITV